MTGLNASAQSLIAADTKLRGMFARIINESRKNSGLAEEKFCQRVSDFIRVGVAENTDFFQNLLSSTPAPLPEYKTASVKKSRFILSHYGMFKSCWDWVILLATFYVAVVVPYNASFVTAERPSAIIDVLVEALFFIGKSDILKIVQTRKLVRETNPLLGFIVPNNKILCHLDHEELPFVVTAEQ